MAYTLIPQVLFEGILKDHKLNNILFWRNPVNKSLCFLSFIMRFVNNGNPVPIAMQQLQNLLKFS
jgi:hypothetical protein